jgi:hypothetical protein
LEILEDVPAAIVSKNNQVVKCFFVSGEKQALG